MDLIELTSFLVENLVKNKENVSINQVNNEKETIVQILVDADDIGSIIGKNGNIANAIRTIIQASGYVNNLGKIRVNIDTKE